MKRLFLLATAAIVALASCTKTQVVNTEAPEEIAFKTVAGAMTKADLTGAMGVFAYLGETEYFGNTSFAAGDDGMWTGSKYWPADGTLTFTCYAPYNGDNAVSYDNTNKTLTITCDNSTEEVDWLYGTTQPTGTKITQSVGITLDHALAQVEFNFTGAEGLVKLGTVTLSDTKSKGTCTVTYGADVTVAWTLQDGDKDLTYNSEDTPLSSTATNLPAQLVVPVETQNATLAFVYELNGVSGLTYTVDANTLGNWEPGKKYTYNVNIGANEIKFSQPTVEEFETVTPSTGGFDF